MGYVRLVLFAVALLGGALSASAREPSRIALLIGNQAYDPSVGILKNPYNDITVVGDALAKQGFQVLPPIKDAKRTAILGSVRDLARRLNAAGAGAIGFIYYSGHGAAEKDTNINYLIPTDAKEPGTTAFWDESVKLDDVLRLLDGARAAAKFIVFDACRNELQLPTKDTSKGLVPVAEQQGMFIAYASAPGRTASDQGTRSGPYAAALASELARPGLDHLNLFQNVKEAVLSSTGGAQQPWESNGLGRRVYLTGPPPRPGSTQGELSDASREWARVDKTSIAELETFLHRHGSSSEADYAQARLAELKKQQADIAQQATAGAVKKKSDDDARAKVEADRRRFAMLQQQEGEKKRAEAETAKTLNPDEDGLNKIEQLRQRQREVDEKRRTENAPIKFNLRPADEGSPGRVFRDCPDCPEMVVVPAGSFLMGSNDGGADEKPVHQVTIAKPFAVGKFDVTFAEWDACVSTGGCKYKPEDKGWGRSTRPVINVSWNDATKEYLPWLSRKTGKTYRLLTEAEWEYAARAGTTTIYSWGNDIGKGNANCDGCGSKWDGEQTAPVGLFKPNIFGLYDMQGNVWQWLQDCYHDSYLGAPTDGSAQQSVVCYSRVLRGGAWNKYPHYLRSALRISNFSHFRYYDLGFRVGRSLSP
jgi:formylglycine-generating enzyme required for sulfatase activity